MKLTKLDQIIFDLDGNAMADQHGVFTMKRMLRAYCAMHQTQSQEESFVAYAAAMKIHQANGEGEVELTDEEVKVLEASLKMPKHVPAYYVPVMEYFKEMKGVGEK